VDGAVEALDRATELDPQDGAAWSALAQALARRGEAERSRSAAEKGERLHPRLAIEDPELARHVEPLGASAQHAFTRAIGRVARGEYAAALDDLAQVERRTPRDPDVRRLQARAHAALGHPDVAIELLRGSLEAAPDHVATRIELVHVLEAAGRADEAWAELERARAAAPGDASVIAERIRRLAARGDLDGLIAAYAQLAALRPDDARIPRSLAAAWTRKGRHDRAVEALERAVALEPDSAEAHYRLGLALEQLGQGKKAREHFERAAKLDPRSAAAAKLAPGR
jgi:tetratricopeptide (TPR) repeat protein